MPVPRTKRRIYSTAELISVTAFPPAAQTAIVPTNHLAPNSHQETFLRSRSEAQVTVDVNAPGFDIPPEFWWSQSIVYLNAFWVPSNTTVHQSSGGTSSNYLGSTLLRPARYALETNAGEYTVIWTTNEPLVTNTARKSATASTGPNVLFQIDVYDPTFTFSLSYADVSINVFVRAFTLWEDP